MAAAMGRAAEAKKRGLYAERAGGNRGDGAVWGYRSATLYALSENRADTEDIFQTVFLKYVLRASPFSDGDHERAWMIRVTINACKDLRKSFFRSRTLPLEAIGEQACEMPPDHREVLEAVLSLPQKYRDVVYLHYYEGYTAPRSARS